ESYTSWSQSLPHWVEAHLVAFSYRSGPRPVPRARPRLGAPCLGRSGRIPGAAPAGVEAWRSPSVTESPWAPASTASASAAPATSPPEAPACAVAGGQLWDTLPSANLRRPTHRRSPSLAERKLKHLAKRRPKSEGRPQNSEDRWEN